MCLIAYRPQGGPRIPKDVIKFNMLANPHGFGIMWREKATLRSQKYGPDDWRDFDRDIAIMNKSKVEMGVHWRYATHGEKDREMAHPYMYTDPEGKPVLLMHNGIIDIKTEPAKSDTITFIERVLSQLPARWWENEGIATLVEDRIGWSRILLMTPDETVFVNPVEWKKPEANGLRYSTAPIYNTTPITTVKTVKPTKPIILPTKQVDWLDSMEWVHGPEGHSVWPVTIDSDDDGDRVGKAYCHDCYQRGDYYVIEGQAYIDMQHLTDIDMFDPKVLIAN